MKTFLLIHGGGHGAWCWEEVIKMLQAQGHKAYALDMPGSGQDQTPRDTVTLDLCIQTILRFIDANNLKDIILVGHSLSGLYLPMVANQSPDQITSIIFLAAAVLSPGERLIDFIPENRREKYYQMAEESPDNSFCWEEAKTREIFFDDAEEPEAFHEKLTPQAFSLYLEKATATPKCHDQMRYILCEKDQALPPTLCENFAKKIGITPERINTTHCPMLSDPEILVNQLLDQEA